MVNRTIFKILLVGLFCLANIGCSPTDNEPIKNIVSISHESISIESQFCDQITAILPGRGRYDGISLEYIPSIKAWELNFNYIPHRNSRPTPIGLLSLEEIAEISSLIIRKGECVNPSAATREFKNGDLFLLGIDWWLVEDLYTTGLEAARLIPENYKGPMMTKPLHYKEVSEAFRAKGFLNSFCNAFEQPDHACLKIGCEYSANPKPCEPRWFSHQKPLFSSKVKDLPMTEVCKIENCGLKKNSKFSTQLIKF